MHNMAINLINLFIIIQIKNNVPETYSHLKQTFFYAPTSSLMLLRGRGYAYG